MEHWDLDFEQTLSESEAMLQRTSRNIDDTADYSLDRILAEFGNGSDSTEESRAAVKGDAPENILAAADAALAAAEKQADFVPPAPDTPNTVTLQDVLEKTVQTVLSEQENEPVIDEKPRRGLFSRNKLQETEALYERVAQENEEAAEVPNDITEKPEPSFAEAGSDVRAAMRHAKKALVPVSICALLMCAALIADAFGLIPAPYSEDILLLTAPFFVLEVLACIFGRSVFARAVSELRDRRISAALLTSVLCIVTLLDTALWYFLPDRAGGNAPFHAVAVVALLCTIWGEYARNRALYHTFRIAAIGNRPYLVTVTAGGAAKRSGETDGFYRCATQEDCSSRWQRVLLPVILAASLVFSVLATIEQKAAADFLWNFSALLAAANTLSLPLSYVFPFCRLSARLAKGGCALGGFAGAKAIRSSNCVILTDGDLFPPGTITLNGLKVFGEESGKVISYAATMAHAADCGLSPLFDNLMASDGGHIEKADELRFYEEGGISGTIHGENVLFGTLLFFRKKGITLPRDIRLQTGVYLAVDGTLVAVFAAKYMAAENVDWALHSLNRNHITPVLAVRDGNITPSLLKRKFKTDARAVVPKLSTRLALSEKSGGAPYALLQREGLMPYAEVTLGSKRLYRCARLSTFLSFLGSIAGLLLAFYLAFIAAYHSLNCLNMLAFLVLWAAAALLDGLFVDRY